MQILNSLVPIFSVIGLGMLLRRNGFLTAESTQAFNRFAYFFALPLFLFYKLSGAEKVTGTGNLIFVVLLLAVVITFVIAWISSLVSNTPVASRGAAIQAGFRGNLAFIGLPLVLFLMEGLPAEQRAPIEGAVLLALTPVILFFNVGAVIALATYNGDTEKQFSYGGMFWNIAKNPLIWACIGGACAQFFDLEMPTAIVRTCKVVGASAFPLALLGIGSQLISIPSASGWKATVIPAVNKCVVCPLVGWAVGALFGLSGVALQVTIILCAMPTSVSSYVLTEQMKGNADLAAGAVVVSTVVSLPMLAILIWLTG